MCLVNVLGMETSEAMPEPSVPTVLNPPVPVVSSPPAVVMTSPPAAVMSSPPAIVVSTQSTPELLSLPTEAALTQPTLVASTQPATAVTTQSTLSPQSSMTGIHALAAAASATQKLKMATATPQAPAVRIVQNPRVISQPIRIIQPRDAAPVTVAGLYLFYRPLKLLKEHIQIELCLVLYKIW